MTTLRRVPLGLGSREIYDHPVVMHACTVRTILVDRVLVVGAPAQVAAIRVAGVNLTPAILYDGTLRPPIEVRAGEMIELELEPLNPCEPPPEIPKRAITWLQPRIGRVPIVGFRLSRALGRLPFAARYVSAAFHAFIRV